MAGAGVVLCAIVLSVLQLRSLRELESKTAVVVYHDLRQTAESIAGRVEEKVRGIASQCLLPLRAADLAPDPHDRIGRGMAAIRQQYPEVDQIFVFSLCTCRGAPFAVFADAGGVRVLPSGEFNQNPDAARAIEAFRMAPVPPKAGEFRFAQTSCRTCPASGSVPASLYVFRVFPPEASGGAGDTFAGLRLKASFITADLLPQAAAELGERRPAPLDLAVLESGHVIYKSPGGGSNFEAMVPFGTVFPWWRLAVGYRNTTVQGLAQEQFRNSLLITLLVFCGLAVGIAITLRATAREARLAQLKSAFVSNVSHELKTPVAAIRMFAETLEAGRLKDPAKASEYHRVIHRESLRLTRLIDNILDFARMEAGRRQYQFQIRDAAEIVEETVHACEYQISDAGFELLFEAGPGLPPVRIDPAAIGHAVSNLLDNAMKYSADVRHIEIRVEHRDSFVAIEVADRGIGIPPAEHEKIFEKFYRVSTGLVHNSKGSGLGLALCKSIVEAHGGHIELRSEPGQGSTFTILLPAAEPAALPLEEPGVAQITNR